MSQVCACPRLFSARSDASQAVEVDRDDQAAINEFGRLNNRLHELDAELEGKKARSPGSLCSLKRLLWLGRHAAHQLRFQKLLADLEDASNELLITDDSEARGSQPRCPPLLTRSRASGALRGGRLFRDDAQRRGRDSAARRRVLLALSHRLLHHIPLSADALPVAVLTAVI